jgi:hypothetical protein
VPLIGVLRRQQVAKMHRIEGSSEKSNFHRLMSR